MRIKFSQFIKGIFIGAILLGISNLAVSLYHYAIFAQTAPQCSQAGDSCWLLENPGNVGDRTVEKTIVKAIIKAGENYFTFNPGLTNDGCYNVNISGNKVEWNKLVDSSSCQDISNIQIWKETTSDDSQDSTPVNPPSFPACEAQTQNGDWVHYDFGLHGIPGEGNFEGEDDVYSLSQGNFLQCFCPAEGDNGWQTNWWNIQRAGLTDDQKNQFISDGWLLENGSGWNLFNESYLAKSAPFNCTEPTVTPTPTTTPTITETPQPTSTPSQGTGGGGGGPVGPPPVCTGLDLGPYAPTITEIKRTSSDTIHACWTASTPNANDYIVYYGTDKDNLVWNTKVNDSQCVDIHNLPQDHIFIKVAATDNCVVGNYSKIVEQQPQVLGKGAVSELPATGGSVLFGISLVTFGSLGLYFYRRFKLV